MKSRISILFLGVLLAACAPAAQPSPVAPTEPITLSPTLEATATAVLSTPTAANTPTIVASPTQTGTPTRTATHAPTATPTLPALPTPTGITFKFDDGVPQDQRDTIITGIAMARAYLGDSRPITVIAYADLNGQMDEISRFFNEPRDSPHIQSLQKSLQDERAFKTANLLAFPMSKNWQARSQAIRLRTSVHEYYHVVEAYLANTDTNTYSMPMWLVEGTAEFAAFRVLARYGYYDLSAVHLDEIGRTRGIVSPLSSMEIQRTAEREDSNAAYEFGYLADEMLAEIAGEPAILNKFWENYPQYPGWRLVFKATFGITEEEFYNRFEEKRRTQFPPFCGVQGAYAAPAPNEPFAIKLVRQDSPGAMVFPLSTWTVSSQPLYSYTFCVSGYSLDSLTDISAFKFPPRAGAIFCGGNCITLYFTPSTQGSQTFAIELPDKRRAEVQFQITIPTGAATPKP